MQLKKHDLVWLKDVAISSTWPQLTLERKTNGRIERFSVTSKSGGVSFKGVIKNHGELCEVTDFLEYLRGRRPSGQESDVTTTSGVPLCGCGSSKVKLAGKGDAFYAPLAGEMFALFKCESCGKYFRMLTGCR